MSMILTRPAPVVAIDRRAHYPLDPEAPQGFLARLPTDVLLRALIARARSGTSVADPLMDMTMDGVRCLICPVHPSAADALSPRELEIAQMVALGYTNKMVASVLQISLWTVSTHLRRIFAKLDVSTRAAMVALIVEPGGKPIPGQTTHPRRADCP